MIRTPPHRIGLVLLAALLAVTVSTMSASGAGTARVTFDHLTWAPEGSALAVEARFESSDGVATDTLLVDLTEGSVATRQFRPSHFALDAGGRRIVAAGRYAMVTASLDDPDRLERLSGRDPARQEVVRLSFTARGDSVLLLSRTRGSVRYELSAWPWPTGRQAMRLITSSRTDAIRAFNAAASATRPLAVEEDPLPHLYRQIGSNLFHLEASQTPVPGVPSFGLFNLFHRDMERGQSKLLATNVAPYDLLASPDSAWVAVAGHRAVADYGGRLVKCLWIASTDGAIFFSVAPTGERSYHPADVRAMCWVSRKLWYSTPDGLFSVDPATGRAVRITLGPPPPVWSAQLAPSTPLWTLLSRSSAIDTAEAVRERERLRKDGWPAWVTTWQGDRFRAAIGSAVDEASLAPLSKRLVEAGHTGFSAARVDPVASGSPFPWGMVKSPVDSREAYLVSVGPPGFTAGEIWLTELQGARQIRLVKAMLVGHDLPPGSGYVPEPPEPGPR
ncbi:MAG TPA: hypothetical protein VF720_00215 [Candidatus Eisenbacteria bacterium]